MSRDVDLTKKLSPEDRDYLIERSRQHQVAANDRKFGKGPQAVTDPVKGSTEGPDGEEGQTYEEWVESLTVEEMKAELGARDMSTSGNKAELATRLVAAGPEDDE